MLVHGDGHDSGSGADHGCHARHDDGGEYHCRNCVNAVTDVKNGCLTHFREKDLEQTWHWKGLRPVCRSTCRSRCSRRWNVSLQCSQDRGFGSDCVCIWICYLPRRGSSYAAKFGKLLQMVEYGG
jgi:hypothetical protein